MFGLVENGYQALKENFSVRGGGKIETEKLRIPGMKFIALILQFARQLSLPFHGALFIFFEFMRKCANCKVAFA